MSPEQYNIYKYDHIMIKIHIYASVKIAGNGERKKQEPITPITLSTQMKASML